MDLTSMPHFQSVTSHIYVVLLPSLLEVINISISLVFSCLSLNTFVMLSLIYLLIYTLFFFNIQRGYSSTHNDKTTTHSGAFILFMSHIY